MAELLQYILNTLNTINVHGAEDMQKMLGCMEAIKQLIELANHPPDESEEPKEEGSELTDG